MSKVYIRPNQLFKILIAQRDFFPVKLSWEMINSWIQKKNLLPLFASMTFAAWKNHPQHTVESNENCITK